ncbi:MAG TPA: NADH-quinone oxidoreductase subunit H [Streptosporangiaceae bacterium]|nr:NADH-quinone oxidoreductase subunit H [Streptosporangiaceae bacterium]
MIASAPLWSVLVVPALLAAFTAVGVMADALLAARADGRRGPREAAMPLAEVPRLLAAQRRVTLAPDALLWRLGLATVPVAGVLAAVVIPFGQVTASRMSVGVVWFNAMEVLTWAGLWAAGWGPNAVLPLVGGYRFVAQGLAYELPLMFALISAAAGAQSLDVAGIATAQGHLWFAVWMPAAFVIYLASVYAFSFLGPFGYPAGRDLAGGVLAELSGPDRLVLQAGRWLLLTAGAAMAVPLFLGGGAGPLLPAWAWSAVKTVAVLLLLVWGRRRLPVLRADRYAELAWVVLIPLAIAQALAVALVVLMTGGTP